MIIKRLLLLQAVLAIGLSSVFFIPRKNTLGPAGLGLKLPEKVGRWTGDEVPVSKAELAGLADDTKFSRKWYTNSAGDRIYVSIVLSGADMSNSIHRPERCLASQGWTVESSQRVMIPVSGAAPLEVTKLTDVKEGRLEEKTPVVAITNLNYYWFIGSKDITASHWTRTYIDIRDRLLHGSNQRWAYVTVAGNVTDNLQAGGRNQEETANIVQDFIAELVPLFQPGGDDGSSVEEVPAGTENQAPPT